MRILSAITCVATTAAALVISPS